VACDRPAVIAASADPRVRQLVDTLVSPPEEANAR